MLVLSRKIGERILMRDGELVLTVVGIEGKSVRLGISAPVEVDVHPDEGRHQLFYKNNRSRSVQSETDQFRTLLQRSDLL